MMRFMPPFGVYYGIEYEFWWPRPNRVCDANQLVDTFVLWNWQFYLFFFCHQHTNNDADGVCFTFLTWVASSTELLNSWKRCNNWKRGICSRRGCSSACSPNAQQRALQLAIGSKLNQSKSFPNFLVHCIRLESARKTFHHDVATG